MIFPFCLFVFTRNGLLQVDLTLSPALSLNASFLWLLGLEHTSPAVLASKMGPGQCHCHRGSPEVTTWGRGGLSRVTARKGGAVFRGPGTVSLSLLRVEGLLVATVI